MKWSSGTSRRGGNRATSLTGSDAGGHGYGKREGGASQLEEGVRVRVVLDRQLAERLDVIAHLEWITPQEAIRCAVARYCAEEADVFAGETGDTSIAWWQDQLARLRSRGKERAGL